MENNQLNFQHLTLDDIDTLRPFLAQTDIRLCDATVGGIFMWRDFFALQWAIRDGCLIFKAKYLKEKTAFTMPLGGDVGQAVAHLADDCRASGQPLAFCTVAEPSLALLRQQFPDLTAHAETDWFDYLYRSEDLIKMAGRRFSSQRTHINAMYRNYPDCHLVPIGQENLPQAQAFLRAWHKQRQTQDPVEQEEQAKVMEVFQNYEAYGFLGGLLMAEGKVAALAAGEIVGDTLFVHIEKADLAFSGAYQTIVREFAGYYGAGTTYINREEDVGDPGLRTSKQSYHPLKLLEKYTVEVAL